MNALLQIWEEYNINEEPTQDGCSLHLDYVDRCEYVNEFYSKYSDVKPISYGKAIGEPVDVFLSEKIENILKEKKTIRLMQNELNNLLSMEDIIIL